MTLPKYKRLCGRRERNGTTLASASTWRELYDALNHPTVDMASVADKLKLKLPKSESDNTYNSSDE